jgi:hypothetical protein
VQETLADKRNEKMSQNKVKTGNPLLVFFWACQVLPKIDYQFTGHQSINPTSS